MEAKTQVSGIGPIFIADARTLASKRGREALEQQMAAQGPSRLALFRGVDEMATRHRKQARHRTAPRLVCRRRSPGGPTRRPSVRRRRQRTTATRRSRSDPGLPGGDDPPPPEHLAPPALFAVGGCAL